MDKEEVLKALRSLRVGPTKVKRLAKMLGVSAEEYVSFKWALAELAREGRIMRFPRNRYTAVHLPRDLVVGRVEMIRSGAAFVVPEDRQKYPQDIYVSRSDLRGAMNGDKVLV
ncbi:MAG: ribonuclease R, partial [Planctomycetota bacterium]